MRRWMRFWSIALLIVSVGIVLTPIHLNARLWGAALLTCFLPGWALVSVLPCPFADIFRTADPGSRAELCPHGFGFAGLSVHSGELNHFDPGADAGVRCARAFGHPPVRHCPIPADSPLAPTRPCL